MSRWQSVSLRARRCRVLPLVVCAAWTPVGPALPGTTPPAAAAAGAPLAQQSDDLRREAADAAGAGDWLRAVELLRRARQADPGNAAVLVDLGTALEVTAQVVEAITVYREALEADPGAVAAAENLAELLASRDDLDGAIYVLEAAIGRRPDTASLHYHLALLLLRREQGPTSAAVESLERARQLGYEQPHLYLLLGRMARLQEGPAAAVDLLRRGLERAPDDFELLREQGITLGALGDSEGAARAFEDALRQRPGDAQLAAELARVYLQADRARDALSVLEPFDGEQDPDLLYLLARVQAAVGDPAAETTLRRYREIEAHQRETEATEARALAEVRAGIVAWESGEVDAAAQHFEAAAEQRADWDVALAYLATARLAQGRPEVAAEIAEDLLRTYPDNAQALMVLGRARLDRDPQQALAALERAVERYPFRVVCLLTLAEAYLRVGRVDAALPLLDRAEQVEPDNAWARELRERAGARSPQRRPRP